MNEIERQAENVIKGWVPGPILHAPMPGSATQMTRCGVAISRAPGIGPATALSHLDVTCLTCIDLREQDKIWMHSGPCIYCNHGPACVTCDLTQGPHWGAAGHEYPGPVCGNCSAECKRREIAADPYYRGDYVEMFGDDE